MFKYFNGIKTIQELKKEYKRLALINHPDRGGNEDIMKQINAEYDIVLEKLKDTANEDVNEFEYAENFKSIINKLIQYNDLVIEICGSWLWVSGNTYPYKKILKELGFVWRNKKQMWSLGDKSNGHHKEWSMDKIRVTFGSQVIKPEQPLKLN